MRTWGVAVALLLVAALIAPPAVAQESLQASGSITYTWQGSPGLGCAAIGVCDVQGALIVDAQGGADVQGGGRQTIIDLGSGSGTVRVVTGTGQDASECVDAGQSQFGVNVFVRRSGAGLVGAIEPALSSGRCAGPLASQLGMVTLPVRKSPGKHPSFDLRTSRAFTAGPFAGTLVSTLMLRPATSSGFSSSSSSSGGFLPPATGPRKVLVEHVNLRYRVTGASNPLVVSFSGETDPFCAVLGACGASGKLSLTAQAFSGTLALEGSRVVTRPGNAQQVIADVRHGRISLFGDLTSRLVTSETFASGGGSGCVDSAANATALVVGGFPPAGKTQAVLSETGPALDVLRTNCPGPSQVDVFGSNGEGQLAHGPVNVAQLLARHSTLSLSDPGGFSGLGYVGLRSGAVAFSLSLEGIRAGTSEETR